MRYISGKLTTMRFISPLIIAFVLVLISASDGLKGITIGDQLPIADHKLKNVDKTKSSLKEYAGKRGLLVIFSCNTCPFVVGSDNFEGWEKDYGKISELANKNDIGFVLVNSNEAKRKKGDGFKDMIERAKEYKYDMPYLFDEDHVVADAFGAKTTPHVYLFDASLKLIYKGSIDDSYKPRVNENNKTNFLQDAILNDAAGETINPNTTPPKGCSIKRK